MNRAKSVNGPMTQPKRSLHWTTALRWASWCFALLACWRTTVQTALLAPPDELVNRLFESTLGAMDLFSVYLGDRLGYYRTLYKEGPATSAELARRTGTAERYAREWLEQQAVTRFLACENPDAPESERR